MISRPSVALRSFAAEFRHTADKSSREPDLTRHLGCLSRLLVSSLSFPPIYSPFLITSTEMASLSGFPYIMGYMPRQAESTDYRGATTSQANAHTNVTFPHHGAYYQNTLEADAVGRQSLFANSAESQYTMYMPPQAPAMASPTKGPRRLRTRELAAGPQTPGLGVGSAAPTLSTPFHAPSGDFTFEFPTPPSINLLSSPARKTNTTAQHVSTSKGDRAITDPATPACLPSGRTGKGKKVVHGEKTVTGVSHTTTALAVCDGSSHEANALFKINTAMSEVSPEDKPKRPMQSTQCYHCRNNKKRQPCRQVDAEGKDVDVGDILTSRPCGRCEAEGLKCSFQRPLVCTSCVKNGQASACVQDPLNKYLVRPSTRSELGGRSEASQCIPCRKNVRKCEYKIRKWAKAYDPKTHVVATPTDEHTAPSADEHTTPITEERATSSTNRHTAPSADERTTPTTEVHAATSSTNGHTAPDSKESETPDANLQDAQPTLSQDDAPAPAAPASPPPEEAADIVLPELSWELPPGYFLWHPLCSPDEYTVDRLVLEGHLPRRFDVAGWVYAQEPRMEASRLDAIGATMWQLCFDGHLDLDRFNAACWLANQAAENASQDEF